MDHVIVFDGVCNFCNAAVNFVIDHDRTRRFRFAALQSDFGRQLNAGQVPQPDSIMLVEGDTIYYKSDAVLRIVRHLDGWAWLYAGRWMPAVGRDWLYDLIARHRYRILGRKDTCRIPTPQEKQLFLN